MSAYAEPGRSVRARPARLDGVLQRAAAIARAVLLWPLRVHANRQLLDRMSGMSEHELSDIGLTRSDLTDSSALRLDTEVGSFLAKRANERRRRR